MLFFRIKVRKVINHILSIENRPRHFWSPSNSSCYYYYTVISLAANELAISFSSSCNILYLLFRRWRGKTYKDILNSRYGYSSRTICHCEMVNILHSSVYTWFMKNSNILENTSLYLKISMQNGYEGGILTVFIGEYTNQRIRILYGSFLTKLKSQSSSVMREPTTQRPSNF